VRQHDEDDVTSACMHVCKHVQDHTCNFQGWCGHFQLALCADHPSTSTSTSTFSHITQPFPSRRDPGSV
jgi:hypothetical protein